MHLTFNFGVLATFTSNAEVALSCWLAALHLEPRLEDIQGAHKGGSEGACMRSRLGG